MKIAVFGTGYVGLVTGTCLAEMGNQVTCIDIDSDKIANLQKNIISIFEPGLAEMVHENCKKDSLVFTTDPIQAIKEAEIIFIAVGTPPDEDGSADLQYVLQVAKTIGKHINGYKVIANKSTVPIGSAKLVEVEINETMQQRGISYEFDVVSNPEFLKEGSAIDDCMNPDRIVIGSNSTKATDIMKRLYSPFNRAQDKVIVLDLPSAEMTKYASNAMLAAKISFMNEMSQIAEKVGADIESVRIGIGSDRRIGYHFIYPGCGYGGSCFPKDVKALKSIAEEHGHHPSMLTAIETVNEQQKTVLFDKIYAYYKGEIAGKTIAIWGLAFKPNTDDIREAPARALIEKLWDHGVNVQLYDPEANDNFYAAYGIREDYQLYDSAEQALIGADALAIVTEWPFLRSPDFNLIKTHLKSPTIFDGRNVYDPRELKQRGFEYFTIGRSDNV